MPREFNKSIITDKGAILLNRAQAGETMLEFTRMVIGDGTYAPEEASMEIMQKAENLKSPKQSYPIIEKSFEGERCLKLTTVFYNADPENDEAIFDEGFFINEIGLFCQEKDNDETEVLYSITTVKNGPGDYMPAYNGENRAEIIQTWYTTISNSGTVYIKYTGGTFALAETVDILSEKIHVIKESIFDEKNEFNVSAAIIDFDDTGEAEGIESFTDFMSSFIKNTSIYQLFSNLKSGLKYVLHAGQLVNNGLCETPGKFPLDAAYGKDLQDQITGLYSDIRKVIEIVDNPSQKDINKYTKTGFYAIGNIGGYTNLPVQSAGILIVFSTGSYFFQIYSTVVTNLLYYRSGENNRFNPWAAIA